MKKRIHLLLALLVLASLPLRAAEITVFAAASPTASLKKIAAAYEPTSGDKIVFNFAASSTLARQIAAGAPADIFFSADEAQMDRVSALGLIATNTRVSLLGNTLVVVVRTDSTRPPASAADLTNAAIQHLALADPKAVPAGVYAKKWLANLSLWPVIEPKVIPCENVRAALAAVESGNVDAGIVYQTDARISSRVKIAFAASGPGAPAISYPLALVKNAPNPDGAQKFLQYLESGDAGKIFAGYGFMVH
jgi:molybdate transport system substrate-binding protein